MNLFLRQNTVVKRVLSLFLNFIPWKHYASIEELTISHLSKGFFSNRLKICKVLTAVMSYEHYLLLHIFIIFSWYNIHIRIQIAWNVSRFFLLTSLQNIKSHRSESISMIFIFPPKNVGFCPKKVAFPGGLYSLFSSKKKFCWKLLCTSGSLWGTLSISEHLRTLV